MNIDKDRERVKDFLEKFIDVETGEIIEWSKPIHEEEIQSISNVLSELETKDKIIDCMANKFYELYKIYPRNNRQFF